MASIFFGKSCTGSSEQYPLAPKTLGHYMFISKAFYGTATINATIDVLMGRRSWRPEPPLDITNGFQAEVLR